MTPILAKCMQLEYFFSPVGSSEFYDFEKIVCFCLLYTKSTEPKIKNKLLFEMMANYQTKKIDYSSAVIGQKLEILITITCFIVAYFIQTNMDMLQG